MRSSTPAESATGAELTSKMPLFPGTAAHGFNVGLLGVLAAHPMVLQGCLDGLAGLILTPGVERD